MDDMMTKKATAAKLPDETPEIARARLEWLVEFLAGAARS
jgi:hypothetical protein